MKSYAMWNPFHIAGRVIGLPEFQTELAAIKDPDWSGVRLFILSLSINDIRLCSSFRSSASRFTCVKDYSILLYSQCPKAQRSTLGQSGIRSFLIACCSCLWGNEVLISVDSNLSWNTTDDTLRQVRVAPGLAASPVVLFGLLTSLYLSCSQL